MNLLYLNNNDEQSDLIALQLEGESSYDVCLVNSAEEAIELLKFKQDQIHLIISDLNECLSDTCLVCAHIIKSSIENIPLILLGQPPAVGPREIEIAKEKITIKHINNSKNIEEIVQMANDFSNEIATRNDSEFCKIALVRFLQFSSINCDVFIRLSEEKFIKIIAKNDSFRQELIIKFMKKDCKYFYVHKKDFKSFSLEYGKKISGDLSIEKKSPHSLLSQTLLLQVSGLELIHEQIMGLGIDEDAIKNVDILLESCMAMLKKNNLFKEILKDGLNANEYHHKHALLIAYLCGAIAIQMSWDLGKTAEKLVMAALLHDQYFDVGQMGEIHDLHPEKVAERHQKIQQMVKEHSEKAAGLVREGRGLPMDVDTIIACHHERPDGSGYPRGMTAQNIPALAAAFIVAEDFIVKIVDKKFDSNLIASVMSEMDAYYSSGHFAKIIPALKMALGL